MEIHNNDKYDGHCHVKVDIYFTAVGMIDIPTEKVILAMTQKIRNNPQSFKFVAWQKDPAQHLHRCCAVSLTLKLPDLAFSKATPFFNRNLSSFQRDVWQHKQNMHYHEIKYQTGGRWRLIVQI